MRRIFYLLIYITAFNILSAQDTLIKKSGVGIAATIVLSNSEKIDYILFNSHDKSVHSENLKEFKTIIYANGNVKNLINPELSYKKNLSGKPQKCDSILLTNGKVILAEKILEITSSYIKYKRLNLISGPDFLEDASNVKLIIFSNGTKEHISKLYQSPTIEKQAVTKTIIIKNTTNPDTLETIVGKLIIVEIISSDIEEVKFKKAEFPDGPTYFIKQKELKRVSVN